MCPGLQDRHLCSFSTERHWLHGDSVILWWGTLVKHNLQQIQNLDFTAFFVLMKNHRNMDHTPYSENNELS